MASCKVGGASSVQDGRRLIVQCKVEETSSVQGGGDSSV